MRVLVADDEVSTAKALGVMLRKNMYAVDLVHNGKDALNEIRENDYDVVVLDIMMPGMDGISVLKQMRSEQIMSPVMLLTARSEVQDRVAGLEAGADDYLAKPFASAEFLARVRALSRRRGAFFQELLTNGNLSLDVNRYELKVGDTGEKLNNKEFQLMELLMRHPGFIYSAEHLMDTIWGRDCSSNIDVVWTHIGFLRKKMKKLGADVEIKNVRGAGYMLKAGRNV